MYPMTLMMPSKSDLQDTIIVHQKNQMHPGSDIFRTADNPDGNDDADGSPSCICAIIEIIF